MENIDLNTEFVKIFGQYHSRLMKLAMRYVRDSIAAEDIVSESFVAFFKACPDLDESVNKTAYLVTIVKNNCLNHLIAESNHLRIEKNIHGAHLRMVEAGIRSLEAFKPEKIFAGEVMKITQDTLSKFSALDRKVFEKSRFEGKTYAEIARECNIPVRKVTAIIQKVLSKLRIALKDYL